MSNDRRAFFYFVIEDYANFEVKLYLVSKTHMGDPKSCLPKEVMFRASSVYLCLGDPRQFEAGKPPKLQYIKRRKDERDNIFVRDHWEYLAMKSLQLGDIPSIRRHDWGDCFVADSPRDLMKETESQSDIEKAQPTIRSNRGYNMARAIFDPDTLEFVH